MIYVWNQSKSSVTDNYTFYNSYYCYGYYPSQSFGNSVSVTSNPGSGTKSTVSPANVINGSSIDWGHYENSTLYLKVGNGSISSGDYGWVSVTPKRVYIMYKDSESEFYKETYKTFAKTGGSSATHPILSIDEVNLTASQLESYNLSVYDSNNNAPVLSAPTGKKFKGWNTAADGSGDYYTVGTDLTVDATTINYDNSQNSNGIEITNQYYELTLYAIWEWDGLGNIGGKKALCYICDGHDENNDPIWKQVLPYAYIRNSENVLGWRLGVGGSS